MYLVTGGAGFIGSHLTDALVGRGEKVRVFDNFSTGSREHLRSVEDEIEIVEGDLRDYDAVRKAMDRVSHVLHQAALRSVERSVDDPLSSDEVNVHGTLHVLMAARDAKEVKRVVYASSSSVYGDNPELPKREDLIPQPVSPYAVSKLAAEQYCRVFTKLYGLETVSLRYFNVFGPRQDPNSQYAAVVPLFMEAALQSRPLQVHGDGKQSRDFTFIADVVQANLLAATTSGVEGSVFNVARNERHMVIEIARIIEKLLGRPVRCDHVAPRRGDVRHTLASISAARDRLGYRPEVGFEEGLRRTFEALRQEISRRAS